MTTTTSTRPTPAVTAPVEPARWQKMASKTTDYEAWGAARAAIRAALDVDPDGLGDLVDDLAVGVV